jgi:hypothetical protein
MRGERDKMRERKRTHREMGVVGAAGVKGDKGERRGQTVVNGRIHWYLV